MDVIIVIAIAIIGTVDSQCNQDSCVDLDEDCWAGYSINGVTGVVDFCLCSDGLEARETGNTLIKWIDGIEGQTGANLEVFEYECCDVGSGGAHSDGTCGNIETDDDGCTQTKCTSPVDPSDPLGETNCWAGTPWMGCTCSDGWTAVETGISQIVNGFVNHEYTCCPEGGTSDGTCGDLVPYVPSPGCNQDSCADMDAGGICWAGFNFWGTWDQCICSDGLHARETGNSFQVWAEEITNFIELFEFECCEPGTEGAGSDGFCGDHSLDENGCTQTKCTSPNDIGGFNCWAGTVYEACTCEDGWTAVETGASTPGDFRIEFYEYTCCRSGGTTDGMCGDFVPYESPAGCEQSFCSDDVGNCWGGYEFDGNIDKCSCFFGLEARETGRSTEVWIEGENPVNFEAFEYECCNPRTEGAHSDGTCGNVETDDDGCTQTKCTSPADTPGSDCYAGTVSEGCTCSNGWTAVVTGREDVDDDGTVYYEYTCCPRGGTTNGKCGDFVPSSQGFDLAVLIIIIIVAVVVIAAIARIALYCCRRRSRRKRVPSKAVPINQQQPASTADGMHLPQAQQALYGQRAQKASPNDAAKVSLEQTMGAEPRLLFVPPAAPQMDAPATQLTSTRQTPQQGVVQMVMGQDGQWMLPQPQWVQRIQAPHPPGVAQHGSVQLEAPQQMQYVYRTREETGAKVV